MLTPQNYYRLPWSLTDNGISWLEVTTSCNLACTGCYRPRTEGTSRSRKSPTTWRSSSGNAAATA